VDGVRLETAVPLERWSAAFSSVDTKLELEARATSAPIDFAEPAAGAVARESGLSRYEQLCEIRGELSVAGARRSLAGVGRRVHAWGPTLPPKGLRRSLYAVSSEEALTVVTVRPPGRDSHGDELVEARLTAGDTESGSFEDARVSTIYDGGGNIRKAGLELYMPGDEYPRRASGEAVAATTVEADGLRVALSFLRWSVEGSPGHGSYKMVTAA
jgi:hypothetical protein